MLEHSALIVQMFSIVHEHLLRIPEGEVVRLPVHPAGAVLSLADQAGVHLRQLSQCAHMKIILVSQSCSIPLQERRNKDSTTDKSIFHI